MSREPAWTIRSQRVTASTIAGLLLVGVGTVALVGMNTAAMLPSSYTLTQAISDLGVIHAAAPVFNGTMFCCGVGTILTAYFVHRSFAWLPFTVCLAGLGVGVGGVGLFPSTQLPWHYLFAVLTFATGGPTALLSIRVVSGPFRYLCGGLGVLSVVMFGALLTLELGHPLAVLGFGGLERWTVYPVLLWATAFGGYLLGDSL